MKLLLFACAIWSGAYIDPSDGFPLFNGFRNKRHGQETTYKITCSGKCNGFAWPIYGQRKHLQEITVEARCNGDCNLKEIGTGLGQTGTTLVKGLTMDSDEETMNQFCTSDWSLASGPGNTSASSQICEFKGPVKKPTTGSFFIKLLCVNWQNTNQGCRSEMLFFKYGDGDVSVIGLRNNYPLSIGHMQLLIYKCDCWKKDRECVQGKIRTKSDAGYVSITGYTDEARQDKFCTSVWPAFPFAGPRNPDPVSGNEICTVPGDKPKEGSSFYLWMACFNFYNKNQGCTNAKLLIYGFLRGCKKTINIL